ncbi:MAG TPA: two-component regulator propeller domain-containing protein, partial [Segetibacter sp.]
MILTCKRFFNARILLLLVVLTIGSTLVAQQSQYQFEALDVRNGLSGNQVNSIFKDDKGFMWFGTLAGLSRYDGYNFKVFRHKPGDTTSISDDYVNLITPGPRNTLCVLTRTGWNVFDRRTEKFTPHIDRIFDIPKDGLTIIFKDSRQDFWYVNEGLGLTRYTPSTNRKTYYNTSSKLCKLFSNNPTSVAEDLSGNIWISYAEGVLEKLDAVKNKIVLRSGLFNQNAKGENYNYKLFVDADSDVWIYCSGLEKGLFYYKSSANYFLPINKDSKTTRLNANLVSGISQDDNGNIWVATDHGGINLINKKEFSVRYLQNNENGKKSLSQNSLNSIYKDNEGTIWLGTFKKGLNYFHKSSLDFPLFQHTPGSFNTLLYNDVNAFAEDSKGNLWIGTNGGGLLYYNRATGTYKQYLHDPSNPNSLSNNVVVSLLMDKQGKLWIGTYFGGLNCYEGNNFVRYKHDDNNAASLADDRVWEIFEDSQNRLWIGTFEQGLDLFDRNEKKFIHHRPGSGNTVRSGYISSILETTNGDLWVGTAWGIDVLSKKTGIFTHFGHSETDTTTISHSNIISIVQDNRGLIWVATKDGLNLYNSEKRTFKVYR